MDRPAGLSGRSVALACSRAALSTGLPGYTASLVLSAAAHIRDVELLSRMRRAWCLGLVAVCAMSNSLRGTARLSRHRATLTAIRTPSAGSSHCFNCDLPELSSVLRDPS